MLVWFAMFATTTRISWSFPAVSSSPHRILDRYASTLALSSSSETASLEPTYQAVFDFAKPTTVNGFDRIDDVIMVRSGALRCLVRMRIVDYLTTDTTLFIIHQGGVSTSTLQSATDDAYARWFGNCRVDGGGFCGIRTLPFVEPLRVAGTDASPSDGGGFYLVARLASDDEPQRWVWKMTTRVKPDRGELLYQARYHLERASPDAEGWSRVQVPFDSFQLVRGPRTIPDGPPLNVTGGIYQIGMTLSKFELGANVSELENFRPGFFELQIKEIGVYTKREDNQQDGVSKPRVLSKDEAQKKRPLLLKLVLPVSTAFFTEQSQRRKSAMRLLREKRGLSRWRAILFGLKSRSKSSGIIAAIGKMFCILVADSFRTVARAVLQVGFVYPTRFVRRILAVVSGKPTKPKLS
jgi:hypothetical protein